MTAARGTSNHPVGEVRHGQLITSYGPGAMVDLPDRSVVVGGLNLWHYSRDDDSCFIDERRLIAKLRNLLNVGSLLLKRPPSEDDNYAQKFRSSSGIRSPQFPLWFVAQPKEPIYHEAAGKRFRTRPLIHQDRLVDEKYPCKQTGGKIQKLDVVPVRFVQCCANGHLSDIDWDRFAHDGARSRCQEDLWLDEAGAGNDFNEIYVRCPQCGKRQALASTKGENGASLLGPCRGHRPWLGNFSDEGACLDKESGKPRYNRLLVRSASNAYFPEMVAAISIPEAEDSLRQHLISHLSFFEKVEDERDLKAALKFMPEKVAARLRDRELGDVMAVLFAVRGSNTNARSEKQPPLKLQEIKALYAPAAALGSPQPESTFHAEIMPLTGQPSWFTERFDRVLKVHRLREVMALIGFSRLEPIVKGVNGDPIDQLDLGTKRADINNKELDWVPAIENFGEGIFLGVSHAALQEWRQRDGVEQHSSKHREACKLWRRDQGLKANEYEWPGDAYLMLHSLSHLLISTAALECGYGASAIKERIYSFPEEEQGYGILLYTSGSGSEGTLGGLVSLADRIDQLVADALELGRLCSNDPFCSLHHPESDLEKRYSHGAACHGCLLIAETSCEQRNQFLDRAFVVPTLEVSEAAFFPAQLP